MEWITVYNAITNRLFLKLIWMDRVMFSYDGETLVEYHTRLCPHNDPVTNILLE